MKKIKLTIFIAALCLCASVAKSIDYRVINGIQVWMFSRNELIAACGTDVQTNQCGHEKFVFQARLVNYLQQKGTNLPPDAVGYVCEMQGYVSSTNSPTH